MSPSPGSPYLQDHHHYNNSGHHARPSRAHRHRHHNSYLHYDDQYLYENDDNPPGDSFYYDHSDMESPPLYTTSRHHHRRDGLRNDYYGQYSDYAPEGGYEYSGNGEFDYVVDDVDSFCNYSDMEPEERRRTSSYHATPQHFNYRHSPHQQHIRSTQTTPRHQTSTLPGRFASAEKYKTPKQLVKQDNAREFIAPAVQSRRRKSRANNGSNLDSPPSSSYDEHNADFDGPVQQPMIQSPRSKQYPRVSLVDEVTEQPVAQAQPSNIRPLTKSPEPGANIKHLIDKTRSSNSAAELDTPRRFSSTDQLLTPPATAEKGISQTKVSSAATLATSTLDNNSSFFGGNLALKELREQYETRIAALKEAENERISLVESRYKAQLAKMQANMERLIAQVEYVEQAKTDLNGNLEAQLQDLRGQLDEETKSHEQQVNELLATIDSLQIKLSTRESEDKTRTRYEAKISALKAEHAAQTADLIKRFERERASALDIQKAKLKSEMESFLPQLKEQYRTQQNRAVAHAKTATERAISSKYESLIKNLKEEHRRTIHQALDDQKMKLEIEMRQWKQALKDRYERRLLEVRNETERRLLARFGSKKSSFANY